MQSRYQPHHANDGRRADWVPVTPGATRSGPAPAIGPPLLFSGNRGGGDRRWQYVFLTVYSTLAVVFLALGDLVFAASYLVILLFFSLKTTDLDLFAPASLMAHAFGLYILLPLAFNRERVGATALYIFGTLSGAILLYLAMPRLNFGQARWLGKFGRIREGFQRKCAAMLLLGGVGFIASTFLAGFSDPLDVFADPVKYRFFMMAKGMTYFTQLLNFLIISPPLITALAFYTGRTSRRTLWVTAFASALYGLATGSRGMLVGLLLAILIIRHLLRRPVSVGSVLVISCVVIPFISISGEYRMLKYEHETAAASEALTSLSVAEILNLAASRLDASRMFNELVIDYHGRAPHLGLSYVELPIQVIPRAFWPSKPRLPNPEMTRIIGRDDPYLDVAFDFGIFGETYINFLWTGMIAGAVIVALFVGFMQPFFEDSKRRRSPVCVLACALFFFFPAEVVISGLAQVLVSGALSALQVLVLRSIFFDQ